MEREPLLVTAARVLPAADRPVVDDGAVAVGGDGAVVEVGPAGTMCDRYAHARRLDFPSSTVLPGLINAHVHLAFEATSDPVAALRRGDSEAVRQIAAGHARELLGAGVTTARDLGDRDGVVGSLRDQIALGAAAGPRIVSSFAPLTSPAGHCWFLGGEVADQSEISAAVARQAAAGADLIKVMAGGGRLTPKAAPVWESQFRPDELAAAVVAAKEAGLPVAAHAHGTDTMAMCVEAGVGTIEHGGWLTGPTADPRCYELRDDVAEQIARRGIYVCPTRSRNWSSWPPEAGLEGLLERLAWMHRHGIAVIAGTDAGVGAGQFDALVEALELYAAAGWTHREVLAMATTEAADALGLAEHTGRLQPGFAADLLLVEGDPLADLDALRAVQCVVAAGRVHQAAPVDRTSMETRGPARE